jgi:hypothetical protein
MLTCIHVIATNLLYIQKYNIGKETLVGKNNSMGLTKGSQRDVVYLAWPIAPSFMSPKAKNNAAGRGGGLWGLRQPMSTAYGVQINFGDLALAPYVTFGTNRRHLFVPDTPVSVVTFTESRTPDMFKVTLNGKNTNSKAKRTVRL